ncbi:MAG TPA: DUF1579 family protein [Planctomycetota bacterium]|nr:DUF1579 family protein [Planctomycetota bacterium]
MRCQPFLMFTAGAATVLLLSATFTAPRTQEPQGKEPPDMAAMMAKAAKFTRPGPNHQVLERFLGSWRTETRFCMGDKKGKPEAGTCEAKWLMAGRWLQLEGQGKLMGLPCHTFWVIGYDNFKQSFVLTTVNSMDTAMLHSEGDLTQDGKSLISYGTLDEYTTGEIGKMVKYAFRFVSSDQIVLEVHDLPIGEEHTEVVETVFTRN